MTWRADSVSARATSTAGASHRADGQRTHGRDKHDVDVVTGLCACFTADMLNPNDPLLPRPVTAALELERLVELTGELPTLKMRIVVLSAEEEEEERRGRRERDAQPGL